jgi:hypothetical protein
MAISYPLALPTSIGIANITLSANNAVAISQSPFTFQQQVVQHPGQRWSASITIPPVRRDLAEPWNAFLLALDGPVGTFLLGDPNAKAPQGVGTGSPRVNGGSQTGSSLVIDGATPSTTDWLKAGDYIQIGTGTNSRLYKVLEDADSDVDGNVTLSIWPKLRSSPSDNAIIRVNNTVGKFRLTSREQTFSIDNASIYGISFDCVEAL